MIALKGWLHVNFATERDRMAQAPIFKYSDLIYSQNVKKKIEPWSIIAVKHRIKL